MNWVIYCHINKTNQKRYIGLTRSKLSKRFGRGSGYRQEQIAFYNAIQKYGWDGFEHIILEDNIKTLTKAKEREAYWIAYYHTWVCDPECQGYNMTPGGDAGGQSNYTTIMKDKEWKVIMLSELDDYIKCGWHKAKKNEKWLSEHPEFSSSYAKEYSKTHKEQHYITNKKYNEEHKEELKEYQKQYRKEHKDKAAKYAKEYRKTHPDKRSNTEARKAYMHKYYLEHKKYKEEY